MASHRIEIVQELRALEQFCTFKAIRSGEEQERFIKDYLADVEEFPLEAIRKACAEWRKSGSTKFPTPGQLIPMIRSMIPEARSQRITAWSPISEEEYAELDLPAKIRHRRILATEARREASRQAMRLGWDRNAETAPPIYREWMDRADAHDAEAKRLNSHMRYGLAAA